MSNQQVDVVTRQFEHQLAHYTSEKRGAHSSRIVSYLVEAHRAGGSIFQRDPLHICEFGGADGLLLAAIRARLDANVTLSNAELVEVFRDKQADDSIKFVPTSILDAAFPDGAFDVVVARHVLHHLIAESLAATRNNQLRAFAELARVTRPGGLVLIEEHVNPSAQSCRALYYLSRFATQLKLNIRAFEVTPYTVVAFLSPAELAQMALTATEGRLLPLAQELALVPMPLQWRLTMLRRGSGNLFAAYRTRPSA